MMAVAVRHKLLGELRERRRNVAKMGDSDGENDATGFYDFAVIERERVTFGRAFERGENFFFEFRDEFIAEGDAVRTENFQADGSLIVGIGHDYFRRSNASA